MGQVLLHTYRLEVGEDVLRDAELVEFTLYGRDNVVDDGAVGRGLNGGHNGGHQLHYSRGTVGSLPLFYWTFCAVTGGGAWGGCGGGRTQGGGLL